MHIVHEKALQDMDLTGRVHTSQVLKHIIRDLPTAERIEVLFERIYELLSGQLPIDAYYFGHYRPQDNTVDWQCVYEDGKRFNNETRSLGKGGVVSQVVQEKETVLINSRVDTSGAGGEGAPKTADKSTSPLIQSIIIAPIVVKGVVHGVVCLKRTSDHPYTVEIADLIENICAFVALSIEKSELLQKLKFEKRDSEAILDSQTEESHMASQELQSKIEAVREVGHELNQPLTGISGYCLLIKEEVGESHPVYKDVCEIEKQAGRLEQLVYQLQEILRNDEAKQDADGT